MLSEAVSDEDGAFAIKGRPLKTDVIFHVYRREKLVLDTTAPWSGATARSASRA